MKLSPADYEFVLRRDFMSFIQRSFYELNPQTSFLCGPHIEVIASKLEACRQGKIKRLIINLPPRHLKSHCASIAFVAWCLGHDPAKQIICVSYGHDLAEKLARDCRIVMTSDWYQRLFPTRLAERKALNDFMTTELGVRMATSIGGVLTGRGGNMILIDDPLKPDEALSESRRKSVNEWYDNTLLSRLNDKNEGCIIIIMQRLHQDDLVGHVLEQGNWDVLSFPAIAMEDETHLIGSPFGKRVWNRKLGEALHPERESVETLQTIQQTIGEYNFVSQYQQTPVPPGGALVKTAWLQYYTPGEEPTGFTVVQSWDTANKATDLNDFSVCTTWRSRDGKYYLLHVFRKRLNYPELKRAVHDMKKRFKAHTILIEDKASGTQLIQDLKSECIFGVKDYMPPAGTDKIMRLHAQTDLFENGHVYLPKEAPWLSDYRTELTGFPGVKYDDQVDSTSQALDYMRNHNNLEIWRRLAK